MRSFRSDDDRPARDPGAPVRCPARLPAMAACRRLAMAAALGSTALITLFAVGHASAGDIGDAMGWALRTDTSLTADSYRQRATEARLRGSISAFLPTIEWQQQTILSSRYAYSPDIAAPDSGPDTLARREPDQFGLQATLPLFDGFKRYNTYRAAKLSVESGRFVSRNARQQVMLDAATAYLSIVRDRAIVGFRRQQVDNIARIYGLTQKRYELRDSTQTDVALARSRLTAAQVALDAARSDLASSEIEFTRVTGTAPGHFASVRPPDALIPPSRDILRAALVSDNPQLNAARLDAKAAGFTADAAKSELLPTINLIAGHSQQNNTAPYTPKITDTTVKLQIRIPIFEPGAYSHIEEAKAVAIQKRYEVIDSERRTVSSADSLFETRRSLMRQASEAAARVQAMRKAVEGYRIEQEAGYRTIVDTLNALNELAEAQVFSAQIVFTRDKSTYMLAAALGRLEEPDRLALR